MQIEQLVSTCVISHSERTYIIIMHGLTQYVFNTLELSAFILPAILAIDDFKIF